MAHVISIQPVIDTAAYATGEVIGGKITLKGGCARNRRLVSVSIFDADGENDQFDLFFFNSDLTGTSGYTDQAAFAVNAADIGKCVGVVSLAAADYVAAGSDSAITKACSLPFRATQDGNIYLIIVIRASTTFTAATDLNLTFGFSDE